LIQRLLLVPYFLQHPQLQLRLSRQLHLLALEFHHPILMLLLDPLHPPDQMDLQVRLRRLNLFHLVALQDRQLMKHWKLSLHPHHFCHRFRSHLQHLLDLASFEEVTKHLSILDHKAANFSYQYKNHH
jgi:hypothetical protein